jgi:hypothetical protein
VAIEAIDSSFVNISCTTNGNISSRLRPKFSAEKPQTASRKGHPNAHLEHITAELNRDSLAGLGGYSRSCTASVTAAATPRFPIPSGPIELSVRASKKSGPTRPFRRIPRLASLGVEDLPGADNNKYSVSASAIGRPVEVQAYADRIAIRQDGRIVAEHRRSFGRGETIYDPWHYVPVLARRPGALRNGAPFKDWVLPMAIEKVRRRLADADDGDRQMVAILAAALTDGLPAVEAACAQGLDEGVHSADVILNILARRRDPGPIAPILTPEARETPSAPHNQSAGQIPRCFAMNPNFTSMPSRSRPRLFF